MTLLFSCLNATGPGRIASVLALASALLSGSLHAQPAAALLLGSRMATDAGAPTNQGEADARALPSPQPPTARGNLPTPTDARPAPKTGNTPGTTLI